MHPDATDMGSSDHMEQALFSTSRGKCRYWRFIAALELGLVRIVRSYWGLQLAQAKKQGKWLWGIFDFLNA